MPPTAWGLQIIMRERDSFRSSSERPPEFQLELAECGRVRLDTASGQGTGNGYARPVMPIAGPSSNEQGSRRDHDPRDKRGQAGKQQKVLQDSGHDSLPDPLRWPSDLAE